MSAWQYDRWIPCCFAVVAFSWATSKQDFLVLMIIGGATVIYGLLYQMLLTTGFLQLNTKLKYADASEWRSRILASLNASILIVGSILCFLEWERIPPGEGFIQTHKVWVHPITFASLFVAYLHWDFLWLLFHRKECNDVAAFIHHILFIMITHYVLSTTTMVRPFAWLSFTELSVPFLNFRWFLAVSDKKESPWYFRSSLAFAATFLFARVLCYSLGLLDLWCSREVWLAGPTGLHAVVVGLHAGWLLNLFWGFKIVDGLMKAVKKKNTIDSKKSN